MKIKKVWTDEGRQDSSLAVLHGENWIVIKRLLEQHTGDTGEGYSELEKTSDDLIAFLQGLPAFREKLKSMLDEADLKTCRQTEAMEEQMPFQPVFYRDFMLCERHVINSAKGMIKILMPGKYPLVKAYETVFRRPFPACMPKKPFYDNPIYYKGNPWSFVGSDAVVTYPEYATLMDYELELGMIITKEICNATEEEGLEAIGAFCVFNDFSVRNVQYEEMRLTGFGPCKSKDFASSVSNVVVTADEILPQLETLKSRVFINDRQVAAGQLNEFYHSLGKAVAYASKGETVHAGEFMGSGTVPNCCGLENGHFLKPGDTIRLEIDGMGAVVNCVDKSRA